MRHSWLVWLALAVCMAVALVPLGWISLTALRLDEAETAARHRAMLEEKIHLALWRMDSALAPLVAQESARPALAYRAKLPRPADRLSPMVLVHFQLEPDGKVSVPRHPSEAVTKLASRLPEVMRATRGDQLAQQQGMNIQQNSPAAVEFEQRNRAVLQNVQSQVMNAMNSAEPNAFPEAAELAGVPMTPLWLDDNLVLARRVVIGGRSCIQGCLLDWPAIRRSLLESVADLLPEANLVPSDIAQPGEESRRLAAIPVRLVAGKAAFDKQMARSPVRLTLALAWASALVAALAVSGLLAGVLRLSQRRAAFVSAVTHELRTPLTTFNMYTEMLAEGMVPDTKTQHEYLRTLHAEASRLSHLVENVLSYARLERGRAHGRTELITVAQLLEPIRGRLGERAHQVGMELVVEGDEAAMNTTVRANPATLDQILFNLVDNACKYAVHAADKRIHLIVARVGREIQLRVRDHGPGLSRSPSKRLFQAFNKSAHEAADSAPGIGLGLALSRRLAHDMGTRLSLDSGVTDGACFALRLSSG